MIIKFEDPSNGSRHDIDLARFHAFFDKEHEERRPTRIEPVGHQPSSTFNDMHQRVQAARFGHRRFLEDKLDHGKIISALDIEQSRALDALAIKATSDPHSRLPIESSGRTHYQAKMKDLEQGKFGSQPAAWKIIQLRATDSGLLKSSPHTSSISITIEHGHRPS